MEKSSITPWNSIEFYSLFQWISMEYNGKFRDGPASHIIQTKTCNYNINLYKYSPGTKLSTFALVVSWATQENNFSTPAKILGTQKLTWHM